MSTTVESLQSRLQSMDPYDFEEFVADLWEIQGWDTEVTQGARDEGVDVMAYQEEAVTTRSRAIQAKRYSPDNKIQPADIQQYNSVRRQENVDDVVIVTTSTFTRPAQEKAAEFNVKTVDCDDILALLDRYSCYDLLDRYTVGSTSTKGGQSPQIDIESDAEEKVKELRDALGGGKITTSMGWKTVWKPLTAFVICAVGTAALVGALFGLPMAASDAGPVLLFVAVFSGGIVGGIAAIAPFTYFWWVGRSTVDEYHDPVYDHFTDQIEETAREKLGLTGRNVTSYSIETTDHSGLKLVSAPRRYGLVSLVIGDSSVGIVESAWISVSTVTYNSGQVAEEFYYDQVTRLNYENGEIAIYLSDGSTHTWTAEEAPDRAMDDLRDRIRQYKR